MTIVENKVKINQLLMAIGVCVAFFSVKNNFANCRSSVNKEYYVARGKSLFLFNELAKNLVWESNNENIAVVKNGIVSLKNEGKVRITAKSSSDVNANNGAIKEYIINVLPAEQLKCCSYINDLGLIKIYAITSDSVKKIKVNLKINEKTFTSLDDKISCNKSGSNIFWEVPVSITDVSEGDFTAKVFTSADGNSWNSDDKNCEVNGSFLNSKKINSIGTFKRSASKRLVDFIKDWEGFVPKLEEDRLVSNVYNIGYGDVIYFGESFYNNLTKTEGFVKFLKKLNSGIYVKAVNDFVLKNKIECTQNQFDALVSYSYNLGTSWLSKSKLKDLLLSAINPQTGRIDFSYFNTSKTANNEMYQELVGEILIKHHVLNPRRCIPGLLYRRISELNMFLYGEYSKENGRLNKHKFYIPDCIRNKASC